ncbi:MAG: efflux RND transporter periplasmic adaptor subunit [Phycisphaerae bacterium]
MKTIDPLRSKATCLPAVLIGMVLLNPAYDAHSALAQESARTTGGKAKPVRVDVVKSARRPMVRELRIPATLMADEQVDLFAKISGYVERINLDIGDRVKKGDVLVKISVPEMADELRQTNAILEAKHANVRALEAKSIQAQRMVEIAKAEVQRFEAQHQLDTINFKRTKELHEGNAIPEQALDEARSAWAISQAQLRIAHAQVAGAEAEKQSVEADVQVARSQISVAQAAVHRLKTLMGYASIRAPFDGVITVRGVDHGTFVRSAAEGTTAFLLRVAKTDRIRVVLEIPEPDARYVRVGTDVNITVKALGEHPFPAKVSRTASALNPKTRTMRVEVDVDNKDNRFTPGMYAQVAVQLEIKAQTMMVPSNAIRAQGAETIVLVSANGVAKSKPVKVGYDDGIWAEILSGLNDGELVITAAGGAVAPGAAVEPFLSNPQ